MNTVTCTWELIGMLFRPYKIERSNKETAFKRLEAWLEVALPCPSVQRILLGTINWEGPQCHKGRKGQQNKKQESWRTETYPQSSIWFLLYIYIGYSLAGSWPIPKHSENKRNSFWVLVVHCVPDSSPGCPHSVNHVPYRQ